MNHLYFGYGANTNSSIIKTRCEAATFLCIASLSDHELVFPLWSTGLWGGGVSGVIPHVGHEVEGAVYSLPTSDLERLDGFESVHAKRYVREKRRLTVSNSEDLDCWVYLPLGDNSKRYPPSRRYLNAIIEGAVERGFSAVYIEELRSHLPSSV